MRQISLPVELEGADHLIYLSQNQYSWGGRLIMPLRISDKAPNSTADTTAGSITRHDWIGDPDHKVARLYEMLPVSAGGSTEGRTPADHATVRLAFAIGPDKSIRQPLTCPMTTGRNFDDILRIIDCLQPTARHRVATPAQGQTGDDVIMVPAISDAEAAEEFGSFTKVKPHLRVTRQPVG